MLVGDKSGGNKSNQEGEEEVKEIGYTFKSDAQERSETVRFSQDLSEMGRCS